MMGVRRLMASISSRVNSMSASRAKARQCRMLLVLPAVAAEAASAFSSERRVTRSEGRMSRSRISSNHLAGLVGHGRFLGVLGGHIAHAHGADADDFADHGHGVGGELSAASARPGASDILDGHQLVIADLPGLELAQRFEDVDQVDHRGRCARQDRWCRRRASARAGRGGSAP